MPLPLFDIVNRIGSVPENRSGTGKQQAKNRRDFLFSSCFFEVCF